MNTLFSRIEKELRSITDIYVEIGTGPSELWIAPKKPVYDKPGLDAYLERIARQVTIKPYEVRKVTINKETMSYATIGFKEEKSGTHVILFPDKRIIKDGIKGKWKSKQPLDPYPRPQDFIDTEALNSYKKRRGFLNRIFG